MALAQYTDEVLDAIDRWDGIMSAPAHHNRKRIDGIQVLQNRFLERYFATSHWFTPAVWFGPIIAYGIYRSLTDPMVPGWLTATLIISGISLWTLFEYVLHRVIFHATAKTPGGKRRLFMMHGYHHEFPSDRRRLVAPPALSWPIAVVIISTYYLLAGPHYFGALTAGTAIGYLAYDWVHYYTHHARPQTRFGKFLRRFHLEHHFKDQTTHFGLSSPLWDVLVGTYSRPSAPGSDEIEILGNSSEGNFDTKAA